MGLIEKEEAARRLARVILSDIELYNTEKIRAGLDLRREINEGYRLFRSRVAPQLVSLFAEAVAQKGQGRKQRLRHPAGRAGTDRRDAAPVSGPLSARAHPEPPALVHEEPRHCRAPAISAMLAALRGPRAGRTEELSRGKLSKVRLLTALAALLVAGFLVSHFFAADFAR